MGKTVLGSLSSFANQIQIVEKDIESRVGGRNTTFPGTLSLDDLLARVQALEGSGHGGALPGAPSGDISDPTLTLAWWPSCLRPPCHHLPHACSTSWIHNGPRATMIV